MTSNGISEAASKKKRGRPKAWSDDVIAISRAYMPDVRTTRHLQNIAYRQLAIRYLVDDPAFAWVCDKARMDAGEANAWRPGILAELGRFLDEETIKAYAARTAYGAYLKICSRFPDVTPERNISTARARPPLLSRTKSER